MNAESAGYQAGFYVVWRPGNGEPTVMHDTIAEAAAEAERLARKNPGASFHVLKLCSTAEVPAAPVRVKSAAYIGAGDAERGTPVPNSFGPRVTYRRIPGF